MNPEKKEPNAEDSISTTALAKGVPRRTVPLWAELTHRIDPNIPQDERHLIYEELPLFDETDGSVMSKELGKQSKEKRAPGHKVLPVNDDDGKKLREILKGFGFEEWVTFPNADYPAELPERLLRNKKAQRKYEIFCGGFLYFYDEELGKYPDKIVKEYPKKFNGEQFDGICLEKLQKFFGKLEVNKKHTMFFDWGKNYVRIYLRPGPGNPDPPSGPAPPPPETSA